MFGIENVLSEAEELAGILKIERTVTIKDIHSVLLISAMMRSWSAP